MKGGWVKQGGAAAAMAADHVGRARRARLCVYGVALAFGAFAAFLAFAPSLPAPSPSSPAAAWLDGILASASPYRAQVSSYFSSLFPANSSSTEPPGGPSDGGLAAMGGEAGSNRTSEVGGDEPSGRGDGASSSNARGVPSGKSPSGNSTAAMQSTPPPNDQAGGVGAATNNSITSSSTGRAAVPSSDSSKNGTMIKDGAAVRINGTEVIVSSSEGGDVTAVKVNARYAAGSTAHQLDDGARAIVDSSNGTSVPFINQTRNASAVLTDSNGAASQRGGAPGKNQTALNPPAANNQKQSGSRAAASGGSNSTNDAHPHGIASNNTQAAADAGGKKKSHSIEAMASCDMFYGNWLRDDSYPLYPEGSCPHIDESFNCPLNGRPDNAYQRLRWQPSGCSIPRLNPTDMLERLRGKRLVFVGDSLNRNMWESLICILRNSVKDKRKVFEVSGRSKFRAEGSYSFLFQDYNSSVEFFRSPFLVQEWEFPVRKGLIKETLRLDMISTSFPRYKDADIIIFNTGHWWTHEKTSLGKDYYQEGNHVHSELNVDDAFQRALKTWAKWVDSTVNPKKTTVFFRGYSASHFSGGQWNSGGSCDKETEPITNEKYLTPYPRKMSILEDVLHGMKTPVVYLNITRMTDYRKEAHPSVYRKQKLTEEEKKSPQIYQDCSHWCLPGVPDSWNELLYAQIMVKQHQMLHQ